MRKTDYLHVRCTETTKEKLIYVLDYYSKELGISLSQGDLLAMLINNEHIYLVEKQNSPSSN